MISFHIIRACPLSENTMAAIWCQRLGNKRERKRSHHAESHTQKTMDVSIKEKCKSNLRVMVKRRKMVKNFFKKCFCDPNISLSRFKYFSPSSHANVCVLFFKKMSTYFWNSSNCESSPGQLQADSIFISAREDEGQPDVLSSLSTTYLECLQLKNT